MAKKERKEKEKEQPKEKIRVDFAHCSCGWQVSGVHVQGRAEAHHLTHRIKR